MSSEVLISAAASPSLMSLRVARVMNWDRCNRILAVSLLIPDQRESQATMRQHGSMTGITAIIRSLNCNLVTVKPVFTYLV
jgi:hypothetical protein